MILNKKIKLRNIPVTMLLSIPIALRTILAYVQVVKEENILWNDFWKTEIPSGCTCEDDFCCEEDEKERKDNCYCDDDEEEDCNCVDVDCN